MSESTGTPDRAGAAEAGARAGGAVALSRFRSDVAVETKADPTDVVTAADREAQRVARVVLADADPDAAFVAEEGQARESVPETGPAWVVDPVDGTANFVRDHQVWACAVAAVVDGEPVAAATVLPALGDAYVAGSDGLAWNGEPASVSDRADPATVAAGVVGRWRGAEAADFGGLCRAVVDRLGDARRLGSAQATLAMVAAGQLDAVVAPRPMAPWDSVAGVHLVRQAGGTVTDLSGEEWGLDDGLVASNGRVHGSVLAAARAATSP